MIYLTILNTLAIVYLFVSKKTKLYIEFRKEKTRLKGTLLGYRLMLWKKLSDYSASAIYSIYFKVRDRKKIEAIEDANMMIAKYSYQRKYQSLNAKFSWLKTLKDVKEFQKYYSCVDEEIVNNLVSNFKI